ELRSERPCQGGGGPGFDSRHLHGKSRGRCGFSHRPLVVPRGRRSGERAAAQRSCGGPAARSCGSRRNRASFGKPRPIYSDMPVLVRGGGASVPVWPMNDSLLDGRYRLLSPLAEGGMSVVWRGHDEVLARPVAVKVIKAEPGSDAKFAGRVRREARALARISHRHIANVYDFGDSEGDGAPYLVM